MTAKQIAVATIGVMIGREIHGKFLRTMLTSTPLGQHDGLTSAIVEAGVAIYAVKHFGG